MQNFVRVFNIFPTCLATSPWNSGRSSARCRSGLGCFSCPRGSHPLQREISKHNFPNTGIIQKVELTCCSSLRGSSRRCCEGWARVCTRRPRRRMRLAAAAGSGVRRGAPASRPEGGGGGGGRRSGGGAAGAEGPCPGTGRGPAGACRPRRRPAARAPRPAGWGGAGAAGGPVAPRQRRRSWRRGRRGRC